MKSEGLTITMEPNDLEALKWLARGFNYWWSEERWRQKEPINPEMLKARDMAREILKLFMALLFLSSVGCMMNVNVVVYGDGNCTHAMQTKTVTTTNPSLSLPLVGGLVP